LYTRVGVDVAVAGAANESSYAARAGSIVAAHPQLADLISMLAAGLPSSNVDAGKVVDYDRAARVLDTRSLWVIRCGGDTAAGIAEFKRSQGGWLARREGFEDLWAGGRSFIYSVLNPGQRGVVDYGPFCLVIRPGRVAGANSRVFPANSAERYGRDSGVPDAVSAFADVGCWRFASDVAVVEHGPAAARLPPEDWPGLVCGDQRFVEVVTAGPIALSDVTEVRVSRDSAREFNEWSVRDRLGRSCA
jgi:hypothetical protein